MRPFFARLYFSHLAPVGATYSSLGLGTLVAAIYLMRSCTVVFSLAVPHLPVSGRIDGRLIGGGFICQISHPAYLWDPTDTIPCALGTLSFTIHNLVLSPCNIKVWELKLVTFINFRRPTPCIIVVTHRSPLVTHNLPCSMVELLKSISTDPSTGIYAYWPNFTPGTRP